MALRAVIAQPVSVCRVVRRVPHTVAPVSGSFPSA